MQVLVSNIVRKSRGGVAHRDQEIDAPSIRLGRGADCELHLADPRVLLHQATIEERGGSLFVDAHGGAALTVNGSVTGSARLKVGDKLGIGPYELEIVQPPAGKTCAFTLELVRPLADDLAELKLRSSSRIASVGLGKRSWAYLLFVVVAAVFLGLPLAAFFTKGGADPVKVMQRQEMPLLAKADQLWMPGPLSDPHKFFGENCSACHQQAFTKVKEEACLNCHEKVNHHVDPAKFQFASFSDATCSNCHKEHYGSAPILRRDQTFCTSCHGNMQQRAPNSALSNVADFGTAHPQFRPSVVTDAASGKVERIALDKSPQEKSGLKFPHEKHLNAKGIRSPLVPQAVVLGCSDCHKPETGGMLMKPVTFEANCSGCHLLNFEPQALDRKLPHGKPAEAMQLVRDTYASIALRGGFTADASAPEAVRRRPGQELQPEERLAALAWADKKAAETIVGPFGKGLCAGCHEVVDRGNPENWDVVPATLQTHWLQSGRFDHSRHKDVDCASCHAAQTSSSATDVLLPKVEVCQGCHGGETATNKVPSTCVTCHDFHQANQPTFRQKAALPADHGRFAWTGPAR